MPTDADIQNPKLLIQKLRSQGTDDAMDVALRDLLG
jgi:hypothetical protein